MAMEVDKVSGLWTDIRRLIGHAGINAEGLNETGETAEIVVHQLIGELTELKERFDAEVCSGLVEAIENIETTLDDDAGSRVSAMADTANSIRREMSDVSLKLERLRVGVIDKVGRIINYLEGCDHDKLIVSSKYKADLKAMADAKECAWQVYDLIAETQDGRKREDHIAE